MYKLRSPMDKGILALEEMVGVKRNFFADLLKEDDWSFIIKLHALFEAACTHLLLYHLKEPALAEIVSRLELSNKSIGKAAFLEKVGLLGKESRRFVSSLSELRNTLVHDVRNSAFSLNDLMGSFDAKGLRDFAVSFSPSESLTRKFENHPQLRQASKGRISKRATITSVIARAQKDPKIHIWFGAYSVLGSIVDMYDYSDYKHWTKSAETFGEEST